MAFLPPLLRWVFRHKCDVTADDPRLLVHLKSYRNSIPVPKHWAQKRKFLMGKRGIEKPPFQLPDFIQATGIERILWEPSAPHDVCVDQAGIGLSPQ